MKKIILLLCSLVLSGSNILAEGCFFAKEGHTVLQSAGDLDRRHTPQSTFKIPLSLMGFDAGILGDEHHPLWPFTEGYVDFREAWKQDQNPKSWIKESCVWYSQVLTKQLGRDKFQDYVMKFDYGNGDISGDTGQDNGLTNSWLSSSLKISAREQGAFLERMLEGALPVTSHALEMTKKILFVEDLPQGWKLYGKTGMGSLINADGTKNPDLYHGWFIGWMEKGDKRIIFVHHMEDEKKEDMGAGQRAKAAAKEGLVKIIDQRSEGDL